MSVRTFTRHFRREVGTTPNQWLTTQRLAQARYLLETSHLSIEHVTSQTGFGSSASLRQHLRSSSGV
jgi:transcriptional regulator GlxA family with amidase domain